MATKITTALVAALVVGALMTPNHEALARGGGGFGGGGHGGGFGGGGFHGGGFHGGGFVSQGIWTRLRICTGFGYGRRFGFYGGSPYFYGGYGYGCSPYYLRLLRMLLSSTARWSNGGRPRRRTSARSHTR